MPAVVGVERPSAYRMSWVDVVQDAIDRLPWPPWATYLGLWLVLAGGETAAKWSAGAYPVGTFFPYHLVVFGTCPYVLGLMHYLDRGISRALDRYRSVLDWDEQRVEAMRYRLATLPAGAVWVLTATGIGFGLFQRSFIARPEDLATLRLAPSGPTYAYELIVVALWTWAIIFVFAYYMVRQLRNITHLLRCGTAVNLFHVRPLYAFATHAARMSIGALVITYTWVGAYPRGVGEGIMTLFFVTLAALTALALFAFIGPLWGAHQRLEAERQRRRADAHRLVEEVLADQHRYLAERDHDAADRSHKALNALNTELAFLDRVSTWPWPANTLRGFLTAVFLPLVVFTAQQVVRSLLRL
jgi:hypothetical protein